MTQLTANDVLNIIKDTAQHCRENGESDMRTILNVISIIRNKVADGKTREEILEAFSEEDDA